MNICLVMISPCTAHCVLLNCHNSEVRPIKRCTKRICTLIQNGKYNPVVINCTYSAPKLLSAVLRITVGVGCVHLQSYIVHTVQCIVYTVQCTVQFSILPLERCQSCSGFPGQKSTQLSMTARGYSTVLPLYKGAYFQAVPNKIFCYVYAQCNIVIKQVSLVKRRYILNFAVQCSFFAQHMCDQS